MPPLTNTTDLQPPVRPVGVSKDCAASVEAFCEALRLAVRDRSAFNVEAVRAGLSAVSQTAGATTVTPDVLGGWLAELRSFPGEAGSTLTFSSGLATQRLACLLDARGRLFAGSVEAAGEAEARSVIAFSLTGDGEDCTLAVSSGDEHFTFDIGPLPSEVSWTGTPRVEQPPLNEKRGDGEKLLGLLGITSLSVSTLESASDKVLDYFDLGQAEAPVGGVRWKEVGGELLEEATDELAERVAHHAKEHLAPPPLPKKSVQWHYALKDETKGPVSEEELLKLFADGTVKLSTLVWNKTMSEWARFADTPLADRVSGDAPPTLPSEKESLKEGNLAAAAKSRTCPSCGHEPDASDRFCPSCGTRLNS